MKDYILDTNIPILMIKSHSFNSYFKENFSSDTSKTFYLSFVSLGELDSITTQNAWGEKKLGQLNVILQQMKIIPLDNRRYSKAYGDIDAYSQGKLKNHPLPAGMSARNMGKNDLWIAATTAALNAELLSTDKDFMHLDGVFFTFRYIDVEDFR